MLYPFQNVYDPTGNSLTQSNVDTGGITSHTWDADNLLIQGKHPGCTKNIANLTDDTASTSDSDFSYSFGVPVTVSGSTRNEQMAKRR